MKNSEILLKAKKLIDTPEKWWSASHPDAMEPEVIVGRLCMIEAVNRIRGSERLEPICKLLEQATGESVMWWNDRPERTHADVMSAFDRAIALAEADELPKKSRESDADYTKRVLAEISEKVMA